MNIILDDGLVAVIDDDDQPVIAGHVWRVHNISAIRYAFAMTVHPDDGRRYALGMHRLIMGEPQGLLVDHRNGDGLDNRKENLRVCTHAENMRNSVKRRDFSSRFKGVYWYRRRWRSAITHEGRMHRIGNFLSEIEAARAYDERARELFGDFATVNFPAHDEERPAIRGR